MGKNCQQVDIKIEHDWAKTKAAMERLLTLEDRVEPFVYGDADHYELNSLGTISRHRLSQRWYRFFGTAIAHTMPWLEDMLASMRDLNPDDACVSYLDGEGGAHIDIPQWKTAFNYVFETEDANAYTWVRDQDLEEGYPSQVGTAWILNTQVPHGINNIGKRWALSIHFDTNYDRVRSWFDSHPNLVFGDRHKEQL